MLITLHAEKTLTMFRGLVLSGGLFTLIDSLYLGVLRRKHHVDYFQNNINQGRPFQNRYFLLLAVLVWFLLGFGIEAFVLPNTTTVSDAIVKGGLLGFIIYGVYDLTNLATINRWTVLFSVQDILWGTILSATVAGLRKSMQ